MKKWTFVLLSWVLYNPAREKPDQAMVLEENMHTAWNITRGLTGKNG